MPNRKIFEQLTTLSIWLIYSNRWCVYFQTDTFRNFLDCNIIYLTDKPLDRWMEKPSTFQGCFILRDQKLVNIRSQLRFIYVKFSGTPPFARPISPSMAAHTAHLYVGERQTYLGKMFDFRLRSLFVTPSFFCPLVSASRLPQINFHDIGLYIYLVHNPSTYSGGVVD
jgi:hypothetical protein